MKRNFKKKEDKTHHNVKEQLTAQVHNIAKN